MDEETALTTARAGVLGGSKRPRFRLGLILVYVLLILGAVVALFPFFWMVSTSLMTLGETTISTTLLPSSPQWVNYVEAWQEANFSRYFFNSVIITAVTLAGVLFTSILGGYAFARIHFWGREVIFALVLSTLMIPESVTMIPNFMMIRGAIIPLPFGNKGSWLNTLQAISVPFMANGFSLFLLRQFFMKIPDELWDAARIDGAGHLRFLFQIVIQISQAAITTVAIFTVIGSWNAFLWPLLVTTTEKWRPLMVGLYTFRSEAGNQTQLMMAGAVITLAPILILYFIGQKQFTEGIATTGLKG